MYDKIKKDFCLLQCFGNNNNVCLKVVYVLYQDGYIIIMIWKQRRDAIGISKFSIA